MSRFQQRPRRRQTRSWLWAVLALIVLGLILMLQHRLKMIADPGGPVPAHTVPSITRAEFDGWLKGTGVSPPAADQLWFSLRIGLEGHPVGNGVKYLLAENLPRAAAAGSAKNAAEARDAILRALNEAGVTVDDLAMVRRALDQLYVGEDAMPQPASRNGP